MQNDMRCRMIPDVDHLLTTQHHPSEAQTQAYERRLIFSFVSRCDGRILASEHYLPTHLSLGLDAL